MKCYSCGNPAVIFRKYEGRAWCKDHFSRQLESRVRRTIRDNSLVGKGDSVFVALSGGKDSSLVLHLLHKFFGKRPDVKIEALIVNEGIGGYRDESIKVAESLCKGLGVSLHKYSFKEEFGKSMDQILRKKGVRTCTYCGVFRRFVLNRRARELGATKLATGHNLDDEIQSVFINNLKGDVGRLVRLGPRPPSQGGKFVTRIKPLRDIPEKETALYDLLNEISYQEARCPKAKDSVRFDVRTFLNHMEENHPGTKHNVIRYFDTILPALREKFLKSGQVGICPRCGEPTSREVCKACELMEDWTTS